MTDAQRLLVALQAADDADRWHVVGLLKDALEEAGDPRARWLERWTFGPDDYGVNVRHWTAHRLTRKACPACGAPRVDIAGVGWRFRVRCGAPGVPNRRTCWAGRDAPVLPPLMTRADLDRAVALLLLRAG